MADKGKHMKTKERFINHYKEGYMPWVHKKPDFNLVELIRDWPVTPCRAIEMGCGTGTDSLWMAGQGFEVTAVDVSDIAIDIAKESDVKNDVNFLVRDFMHDEIPGGDFDFAFDRGYLHSYDSDKERKLVAKRVAAQLSENGYWLTLVGSCDSLSREGGPPMRSAKNIVDAAESYFEIRMLKTSVFGTESEVPANIWVCMLKKRK